MYRILFSLLLLLVCSCFDNKQKEKGVVVTNTMWQSDVINPMKEALERVALASIRISGDTKGEWA